MKAGKLHIATAALLAALAGASGCQGTGRDEWAAVSPVAAQGDVSLYRDIQFQDVPIPAGYAVSPTESYSFQGAMSRSGIIHYYGPIDYHDALEFYRAELPAAGWNIDNTERGFDFRVFRCSKGREKLIVTVRQIRGGSRAEIQLDDISKNDLLLKGKLPANR